MVKASLNDNMDFFSDPCFESEPITIMPCCKVKPSLVIKDKQGWKIKENQDEYTPDEESINFCPFCGSKLI